MGKKILIIGPSGSGKTYISAELKKHGINAADADSISGLSGWFDKDGNMVEYPKDAGKQFFDSHEFLWNKESLREYLDRQEEIYLFGLLGNVFSIIDLFDMVYFLKVEPEILAKNLRHASRENPMGSTDYQVENALKYAGEIEQKAKELGIEFINATNKSPEQIFKEIKHNAMRKNKNNFAFIDNTNVHKGVEMLGWKLNLIKFRRLIKERYEVTRAYMFIGYIDGNQDMYRDFQNMGYTLIFKPTLPNQNGAIKGNCDAELVLQAMIDINDYDKAVIVTGDGDFQCLVKHLRKTGKLGYVISPNRKWCSILLKREARGNHVFIEEMRSKLELK